MVKPGAFRIQRPKLPEFYLMAVLIPFTVNLSTMIAHSAVGLVASLRLSDSNSGQEEKPRLRLRPLRGNRPTDPSRPARPAPLARNLAP